MIIDKNDVLALQTGCSQIALAKAGLTTPEVAILAGPGLQELCETVRMLYISYGSVYELETQILLAGDLDLI